MGTDTRTGQGGGYGNADTTSSGNGQSDTTILVHISADRSHALGVSIPRDSWVTRPTCGSGPAGTTEGKFNAAFAVGGPSCTIHAVESLTGVRIDHFVVVNFKGFKAVVEALGGVPVCLKEPVNDPKSHLHLPAGQSLLNPDQALAFARARKTLGDGSDISRINRQQVFMSSLIRTATSKNVITDLPKLYAVLNAVSSSLTMDTGLGNVDELQSFASSLQGLTPSKIAFMTVPWVPRGDNENVLWDKQKADPIWQSMRQDTPYPPQAAKPTASPTPGASSSANSLTTPPSRIHVRVLNGSGIAGQARKAADELTAMGFIVTDVGTAKRSDYAQTTVLYDPNFDQSARTLAAAANAGVSRATGTGHVLTLVIGTDWTTTTPVTISSANPSPSQSTADLGPAPKPADQNTCVG
jgi:LCP family protein required for cell wall assembly